MRFSIIVMGHPEKTESSQSAWQFCCAALGKKHQIVRVFFLHDATAQAFIDNDMSKAWGELSQQHDFDLEICITAMEKREKNEESLLNGFTARGLGQLVDASIQADQTVTFR